MNTVDALGKYGDECEKQHQSRYQHFGIPDKFFHTFNSPSGFAPVSAAIFA
jgi:phage portal protein BeeE